MKRGKALVLWVYVGVGAPSLISSFKSRSILFCLRLCLLVVLLRSMNLDLAPQFLPLYILCLESRYCCCF